MSELIAQLNSKLELMISDLKSLVESESPSRDLENLEKCANLICDLFDRELGSRPELIESVNGPHIHWLGGATPKVLILGHYDTVFPLGALKQRPFEVRDGKAYGPGVFDMKAAIVQAVHALGALDDRSAVEVLFTADEEIGSKSSREFLEERAVGCGAVLVLEPSADGGALKIARKGTGTFEVVFDGLASHAGLEPEKGINSILEMAAQIQNIASLANSELGTTVTPTVAHAGTADNVVPAQSKLLVDVRVEAEGEKERVEAGFASLTPTVPGCRITINGGIGRPPMPATASAELFALAQECATEEGLPNIDGVAVGGGSDGNFTAARGVRTLDGLGAVGGGAHSDTEYVLVSELPNRAALLASLVRKLTSES